jgi:hypothetical protein
MKRFRVVPPLACLLFAATVAQAQTGVNLAWNNCITQSNAAGDKAYACDGTTNSAPFKIVFSFFAPVALPEFVGIEALVDVHTAEPTLPDWWKFADGECRAGVITFPGSLTLIGTGATGACQNPWLNAGSGGGYRWFSNSDGDTALPGNGRLRVVMARDASVPASLTANQQYVGGVILLDSAKDIDAGDGTCSGCSVPACIVLNEVQLFQNIGATGGDTHVLTTTATRAYITWQGGQGASCEPVPRRMVWNSIKAVSR